MKNSVSTKFSITLLNSFPDSKKIFRRFFNDSDLSKILLRIPLCAFNFFKVFFEKHFKHSFLPKLMFYKISNRLLNTHFFRSELKSFPSSTAFFRPSIFFSTQQNLAAIILLHEISTMGDHHKTKFENKLEDISTW